MNPKLATGLAAVAVRASGSRHYIAAKLTNVPHGLLRNIIVGLIGALVGGFLFEKLNLVVEDDSAAT